MRMYITKHKRRHTPIRPTLLIAVGLLLLLAIGGVFAKYVWNNGGRNLLSAKEFYFTSDLLASKSEKYVLNSTATEMSFTLGNNADKLRYSDDTIHYSITLECKSGENKAVLNRTSGTLAGNKVSTTEITVTGLEKGKTYLITATGEAGYKRTLSAEITVSSDNENIFKYLDTSNDAYVLLTIWTENVDGIMTIEVQKAGLIPDNTDPVLETVYNYKDGSYTAMTGSDAITDEDNYQSKYSSYTYRFFRNVSGTYSASDFDVYIAKDGDGTYIAKEEIPK